MENEKPVMNDSKFVEHGLVIYYVAWPCSPKDSKHYDESKTSIQQQCHGGMQFYNHWIFVCPQNHTGGQRELSCSELQLLEFEKDDSPYTP